MIKNTPDSDQSQAPAQPAGSFRITLNLVARAPRLDQVLLEELRKQTRNLTLKTISRTQFKALFNEKRIRIKGQRATPSSAIAQGTTVVDILGFDEEAK